MDMIFTPGVGSSRLLKNNTKYTAKRITKFALAHNQTAFEHSVQMTKQGAYSC